MILPAHLASMLGFARLVLIAVTCAGCYASHVVPACTDPECLGGDCRTNFDCAEGAVCRYEDEACGVGQCVLGTAICPTGSCPGACGCDGRDWCNECDASTFGGGMAHAGSCCGSGPPCESGQSCCMTCEGERFCSAGTCPAVVCTCLADEDCGPESYCAFEIGVCRGPGTCRPRRTGCSDTCFGACGCDGNEYCNLCMASAAGVNVAINGPCEEPCGSSGELCGRGRYCADGPDCGGAAGDRECEDLPSTCEGIEGPVVCGCNGLLYANGCEAHLARVSISDDPSRCACLGDRCARQSCHAHRLGDPSAESGAYLILDGDTGAVTRHYCDMETDGGGWTLVASSAFMPLDDRRGAYHSDLATRTPSLSSLGIFDGLLGAVGARSDVRFVCGTSDSDAHRVDLSFYDVDWYAEWVTGSDADSCFSENDGAGADPTPPARRNNLTGDTRAIDVPWLSGALVGEDLCNSTDDFTVDFDDRGMNGNEGDGTDWGEDDLTAKCGAGVVSNGYWSIYVRE